MPTEEKEEEENDDDEPGEGKAGPAKASDDDEKETEKEEEPAKAIKDSAPVTAPSEKDEQEAVPKNGKVNHHPPFPVVNGKPEEAFYLTEIIGVKVYVGEKKVGSLEDFLIQDGEDVAEITHLFVTRPYGYPSLVIPMDKVTTITRREIVVEIKEIDKYVKEPDEKDLLLKDCVLDKKVLDIDGKEVEVVYDVRFVRHHNNRFYVTAVDLSGYGRLKRMGFKWLANRKYSSEDRTNNEIAWTYIQPLPSAISSFKGDVRLKILKESLSELRPVDIAGILEELEGDQKVIVFSQLDQRTAAGTLEEIDPKTQRDLIGALDKKKVATLIDEMTPGQAANVLSVLPWSDTKAILKLLDKENATKIKAILNKQDEKIINYSTTAFIKVDPDMTVEHAQIEYPWLAKDKDVIMYLYVVDEKDILLGVIDIKEVLRANHRALLKDIMIEHLITLKPDNTLKDASIKFMRYDFRALPVLDDNNKILGVVPYRDVMNLTHHFVE